MKSKFGLHRSEQGKTNVFPLEIHLKRTQSKTSYQFVYVHEFLVLLMNLLVFDVQHHFKAFKLLLQIKGVRVLF